MGRPSAARVWPLAAGPVRLHPPANGRRGLHRCARPAADDPPTTLQPVTRSGSDRPPARVRAPCPRADGRAYRSGRRLRHRDGRRPADTGGARHLGVDRRPGLLHRLRNSRHRGAAHGHRGARRVEDADRRRRPRRPRRAARHRGAPGAQRWVARPSRGAGNEHPADRDQRDPEAPPPRARAGPDPGRQPHHRRRPGTVRAGTDHDGVERRGATDQGGPPRRGGRRAPPPHVTPVRRALGRLDHGGDHLRRDRLPVRRGRARRRRRRRSRVPRRGERVRRVACRFAVGADAARR